MQAKVKMVLVLIAVVGTFGIIGVAGYDLVFSSSSPRTASRSRSSTSLSPVEHRGAEVSNPKQAPPEREHRIWSQHRALKSRRGVTGLKARKSAKDVEDDESENEVKNAESVSREEAQLGFERMMEELDEHIAAGKKLPLRQRRQLLEQAGHAFSAWSATLDMDQPGQAAKFEAAYIDFQMRASQLELTAQPPPKKRKYPLE